MRRTLLALPLSGVAAALAALWLAEEPPPAPSAEPVAQGPPAPGGGAGLPDATPAPGPPPAPGEAPARALYGWRDTDGMLHISSTPPGGGIRLEWVQPFSLAGEEVDASSRQPPERPARPGSWEPLRVYTVEGLQDLRARAADMARELEARRRLMEALDRDL
jgi:hypothetical protein